MTASRKRTITCTYHNITCDPHQHKKCTTLSLKVTLHLNNNLYIISARVPLKFPINAPLQSHTLQSFSNRDTAIGTYLSSSSPRQMIILCRYCRTPECKISRCTLTSNPRRNTGRGYKHMNYTKSVSGRHNEMQSDKSNIDNNLQIHVSGPDSSMLL